MQTKLRTFQWFYWVPQSKIEANRSRGYWVMFKQTNRQTEITSCCIMIKIYFTSNSNFLFIVSLRSNINIDLCNFEPWSLTNQKVDVLNFTLCQVKKIWSLEGSATFCLVTFCLVTFCLVTFCLVHFCLGNILPR